MFFKDARQRLILFGGKGGSGKTTSACATALYLAQSNKERRILIVSTDPAHSVGDSFNCAVGNTITAIEGLDNLWALEIDAEEVNDEFNRENVHVLKKIADRGTYFDKHDISDFFSLTMPGIDEVMAVIRISNLLKEKEYDLLILDTAPTGHTVRLLALPKEMERWIKLLDMMQSKHRFLMRAFTGRYKKDDADTFLNRMFADIRRVNLLLKSTQECQFVPVLIPEPMYIDETERLLQRLREFLVPVSSIIVNRVTNSSEKCPFCKSRKDDQSEKLALIDKKFDKYDLYKLPLFPHEVRGIEGLTEYGQILFGKDYKYEKRARRRFFISRSPVKPCSQMQDMLDGGLKFIVFGGKGGVGKTSISSATSISVARRDPEKKVLIFSTDPAHSLADSFGMGIGDKVTPIEGISNLFAYEIDAARMMEERRKKSRNTVTTAFNEMLGGGTELVFDKDIMTELASINFPGFDEIMALGEITDFIKQNTFDIYILDSAASGHLLRFLETPRLMRDWLKFIFRIIIKYKRVAKLTELAKEMVDLSKRVRKIQEILTDSKETEFVAITIAEEMAIAEMHRLLESLDKLNIPCRHIVMNMVIPPTKCVFCNEKRKDQQQYVKKLKGETGSRFTLNEISLFPHKIAGIKDLRELSKAIYGDGEIGAGAKL